MQEFNVRCYDMGIELGSGYQKVSAETAKDAAEMLCNCKIRGESGKPGELCAIVMPFPSGTHITFYSDNCLK